MHSERGNGMKKLSSLAENITVSPTMALDSIAKQMKADGIDVVSFGAGEADLDTPDNIRAAGIKAINDGMTKYTPSAGLTALRQAAANRLRIDCGTDYEYDQIVVASGTKHSIYIALCTLLDPGDEVILPAPYWVSYHEMIRMAGGVPVIVKTDVQHGFKLTAEQLESAVSEKTKVFLINNPSNPSGIVYSRAELSALAEVCVKHDLYVIADEVYYGLVYDGRSFVSFASLGDDIKELTIVINGVSKSYSMTGWRVGYSASNHRIAKLMDGYLSHSTGAPSTVSQYAAAEALTGPQDGIEAMCRVFEVRRNYMLKRLGELGCAGAIVPQGAFYIMMDISCFIGRILGGRVIRNDEDFALAFLEKGRVAVVPLTSFGAPNYVRWTFAASMENIREGMDRLAEFING